MKERSLTWTLLLSPVVLGGGFLLVVWLPGRGSPGNQKPPSTKHADDPELRPRRRPSPQRRPPRPRPRAAVRPLDHLTDQGLRAIRRTLALNKKDFAKAGFVPIPKPLPGDWRLGPGRNEEHQTWSQYTRAEPNGSKGRRRLLVMRRMGPCIARKRLHLEPLRRWMAAFFGRPTRWGEPLPFPDSGRPRRLTDGTGWRQHHAGAILRQLRDHVPDHAAALLAVTCEDLYPEPSWNFVFGMATFRARVGVYSLARLYPSFDGQPWTPAAGRLGLLRALKLLTHETGHMFGIHHCRTFHCIMNGSNSLDESDRAPLHLCPLCLSKLAWNLKLSLRRRYAALARFLAHHGLKDEAVWYWRQSRRLARARARTPPSRRPRRP